LSEPTVSAGLARAYFEFAVARGADPKALAAHADVARVRDRDSRVPLAQYRALVRAGKQLTGESGLPIQFAEAIDMAEFSVVGLLANAAATMREALVQLNRYGQLAAEVELGEGPRFSYEQRDGVPWLVDTRQDPNDFFELTETTFTRMITLPRRFLPGEYVLEAHVTHPAPAHRAVYEAVWRCPVTFGAAWNALRTNQTLRDHRIRAHPAYAFGALSAHAEQLLADLQTAKTARGRVESLLMPILHTGEISMETIAAALGVSRKTLYRHLKEEGVTFEQVLDALRHKLALRYLESQRVSVNETAYLVGFSDPSAFSRAFKRWTGKSPSQI
jgi:AraC-like DNA-binding protein